MGTVSGDRGGTNQGAIKWYDYAGKTNDNEVAGQVMPGEFVKVMPDGTTTYKTVTRNSLGKPTLETESWDDGGTRRYRTHSYTYSADGIDLLQHRFDPSGVNRLVVGYGYDVSHPHLPVRITNAVSEITYQTYDGYHRLVTRTMPSGLVISNTYGGDGFVSKTVEYDGSGPLRTNSFTYQNGLVQTHTDARGYMVSNSWDYLRRPTRVDFPDGTYIRYAYTNGAGVNVLQKTYEVDRLGNARIYEYDEMQRVFRERDQLGRVTGYGFCSCGAANSITNAVGTAVEEVTHYVFDDHHKLVEAYRPDGSAITNAYDRLDRLASVSDAFGTTVNTYDNLGRLIEVSNGIGFLTRTTYDAQDRVITQADANGVTVTNAYDNLGRVLTRTHQDSGIEAWGYTTGFSGPTSYTNQLSKVTTYVYDVDGRVKTNVVGGLKTALSTYNAAGDLVTLKDGLNQQTTFTVDSEGHVTKKTYANSVVGITNGFDAAGRLTARWTAAKGLTTYQYDAVGNLTNVNHPSSADYSFFYDALNRVTADVVVGQFTNVYTYHAGGALATEDGPWASDTITYYKDSAGWRSGMSLQQPTGSFTNGYTYDAGGRFSSIVSHSGTYTYDYYPTSNGTNHVTRMLRKLTLPSGAYITNTFDSSARMTETTLMTSGNVELNDHAYSYNLGNQRTQQTYTDNSYVTYTYDDAGELQTAYTTNSTGTEITAQRYMYGYDAAWNMIKRTNNASVSSYTVNNLNQNTSGRSYDSNGNPTTLNGDLTYDDENRLTVYENTGVGKYEYFYDARGRLRKRDEFSWNGLYWAGPITTIRFVLDGILVVQERDGSNLPQVTYTRGADLSGTPQGAGGIGGLLARSTAYQSGTGAWNTHYFYHSDANGNVTYLMTSAQAVGASYRYDPFGRTITSSGTVASANSYRFSSKQIQPLTGFYYYASRFYDPSSQRWLNRDPVGEQDGPNLYAYVRNQPINATDPWGLKAIVFTLAVDRTMDMSQVLSRFGGEQLQGVRIALDQCACKMPNWRHIEVGAAYDFATRGKGGVATEDRPETYYEEQLHNDLYLELTKMTTRLTKGYIPVIFTGHMIYSKGTYAAGVTLGRRGVGLVGIVVRNQSSMLTLAHELGHMAGYEWKGDQHSDDPAALMFEGDGVFVDNVWCDRVAELAK